MIGSKPVCDACGASLPVLGDRDLADPDKPETTLFVQVSGAGNRISRAKFTTDPETGDRVAGPGKLVHACKGA